MSKIVHDIGLDVHKETILRVITTQKADRQSSCRENGSTTVQIGIEKAAQSNLSGADFTFSHSKPNGIIAAHE
ncbi:MAG: hypothetical protein ACXWKG_10115 [Limisphaerales bacterium]